MRAFSPLWILPKANSMNCRNSAAVVPIPNVTTLQSLNGKMLNKGIVSCGFFLYIIFVLLFPTKKRRIIFVHFGFSIRWVGNCWLSSHFWLKTVCPFYLHSFHWSTDDCFCRILIIYVWSNWCIFLFHVQWIANSILLVDSTFWFYELALCKKRYNEDKSGCHKAHWTVMILFEPVTQGYDPYCLWDFLPLHLCVLRAIEKWGSLENIQLQKDLMSEREREMNASMSYCDCHTSSCIHCES